MGTNADQGVAVKLRVVFHRNEDGPGYWAEVPGFPGCLTEGDTLDEARAKEQAGWVLDHISGSHHIGARPGAAPVSVPAHGNRTLGRGVAAATHEADGADRRRPVKPPCIPPGGCVYDPEAIAGRLSGGSP
jgi:predicted RNA binding protein YcfA (HicA-like mRNA interferase family)